MSRRATYFPARKQPKGGNAYGARVSRQKVTNSRIASLNTKQYSLYNQPAVAVKTPPAALPDIKFLMQIGVVIPPTPPAPRIKRGLSATEHTRRRRAKFYAAGLTARGTRRIKRGYGINLSAPLETDARLRSTFNS